MRKKLNLTLLISGILVVVMIIIIFIFSTQQGDRSTDISENIVDYLLKKIRLNDYIESNDYLYERRNKIFRKLLHFTEYGILAILVLNLINLLKLFKIIRIKTRYVAVFTVMFVFIVASADEFYQSHIPGRTPNLRDILIDTSGAVTALLIVLVCKKIFWKFKKDGAH